jgi:protein O-GlcNAc transferase
MTETLFERYKEALRAGHVAIVRGRPEDAVTAYREAISVAGDRTVPRVALGGAYLRLGDPASALEAFDGALAVTPDDDQAMLGRAQALVVLRRTGEAAATYDRLADLRAADGRPAEAVEAARRAVAIEPTDDRRTRHAALSDELRLLTAPGAHDVEAEPPVESAVAGPVDDAATPVGQAEADDAEAGPTPDPEALVAEAEEALARGDQASAAAAALAAARVYRSQGHPAAAIEACLLGVGARPADPDLHLLLAALAVDLGWAGIAGETYRSLLRLAELDSDAALADEVRAAAGGHVPTGVAVGPD